MKAATQKEAVFQAIMNVMGDKHEGAYVPSKEQRARVNLILFEGFKSNAIELDKSNGEKSDTELKSYVSGLQSNWLRKDKRLNGGTQYVAKNPGSRAGSADPQLKALRALITTMTTPEEKADVQTYIDARVAELNITKTTKVIDFSALPAELVARFQK